LFEKFQNKFEGFRGPLRRSGTGCSGQGGRIANNQRNHLGVDTPAVEGEMTTQGPIGSFKKLSSKPSLFRHYVPSEHQELANIRDTADSIPVVSKDVMYGGVPHLANQSDPFLEFAKGAMAGLVSYIRAQLKAQISGLGGYSKLGPGREGAFQPGPNTIREPLAKEPERDNKAFGKPQSQSNTIVGQRKGKLEELKMRELLQSNPHIVSTTS